MTATETALADLSSFSVRVRRDALDGKISKELAMEYSAAIEAARATLSKTYTRTMQAVRGELND